MQAAKFLLDREDGAKIQVYRWAPEAPPRAIVQIAHGLCEHAGRYARLAEALTGAGCLVYASDHRGHGPSAAPDDLGYFAESDGWRKALDDLWAVNRRAAIDLPGGKIVLFGHSMGSIMGQQFIAEHGDALAGVALSGSNGPPPAILPLGRILARLERMRLGGRGRSALLLQLIFGQYNKPFRPARTEFDWLSRDAAEVDKYIGDPLCGFPFTVQLAVDLLDALAPIASAKTVARAPKNLPIYVLSGARDPVGANIQGLITAYRLAGLSVTAKIYPEARHEMLNELNRDEVVTDFLAWIDSVVDAKAQRPALATKEGRS
jgi:alpha-beta hydrolase superfamily lysophospholipase